jgi:hypothetical protein
MDHRGHQHQSTTVARGEQRLNSYSTLVARHEPLRSEGASPKACSKAASKNSPDEGSPVRLNAIAPMLSFAIEFSLR